MIISYLKRYKVYIRFLKTKHNYVMESNCRYHKTNFTNYDHRYEFIKIIIKNTLNTDKQIPTYVTYIQYDSIIFHFKARNILINHQSYIFLTIKIFLISKIINTNLRLKTKYTVSLITIRFEILSGTYFRW